MADYDVQALGLASPPASAPVSTYYPGIRVRNNGIHPADVTGWLRVYDSDTGQLLQTFDVSRAAVQPGTEATATSAQPWELTEADIGRHFLWNGYITTEREQVPANNPMAPTSIVVTGEVPPPPVVTAHAGQHEAGGTDELSVAGLPGQLAEPQHPIDHASLHQAGGDDVLNVQDLAGRLAEAQTPAGHANEAHTVAYATGSDVAGAIGIHDAQTTAHDDATNLEHTANKGAANGYAGLGANGKVPAAQLGGPPTSTNAFLKADQTWATPSGAASLAESMQQPTDTQNGGSTLVCELPIPAGDMGGGLSFDIIVAGEIRHPSAISNMAVYLTASNDLGGSEDIGSLISGSLNPNPMPTSFVLRGTVVVEPNALHRLLMWQSDGHFINAQLPNAALFQARAGEAMCDPLAGAITLKARVTCAGNANTAVTTYVAKIVRSTTKD